jgi:hypothetical protein
MSLINDALKRAKQAQIHAQLPPLPAPPPLHPVEAAPPARHSPRLLGFAALVVVMILALGLAWQWSRLSVHARAPKPTVQASATTSAAPAPAPAMPAAEPEPAVEPARLYSVPPVTLRSVPAPSVVAAGSPAPPAQAIEPPQADSEELITTPPALPEPAPAKPAPPKLQAIIYNPARPSAILRGQTLFLGERVDGFQVVGISRTSVTLAGVGQTNVLTLP